MEDVRTKEEALALLQKERILRRRRERDAEDARRDLEQFLHLAAHDLQEPLRKLLAFSRLLAEDMGDSMPERAGRDLAFMLNAVERMQGLLDALLDFSGIGGVFEKGEWDPRVSIDRALQQLSRKIRETHAVIDRDETGRMEGDAALLTRLYACLIENALKYTGCCRPMIRLTAERAGDSWILGVRDNGIGMEKRYFHEIFLPFKRLHARVEYPGYGMGLAICRKIVRLHQGRIWVESDGNGKGSHFRFTLG